MSTYVQSRGSSVTSYNVRWDAGFNGEEWFDLIGLTVKYLNTEYIVSTGVTGG